MQVAPIGARFPAFGRITKGANAGFRRRIRGADVACLVQGGSAMSSESTHAPAMDSALKPLLFLIVPFVAALLYGFLVK